MLRLKIGTDAQIPELMLLGFISLAITVGQNYIIRICLPPRVLSKWTPCPLHHPGAGETCRVSEAPGSYPSTSKKLLDYGWSSPLTHGRMLADANLSYDPCQGSCGQGVRVHGSK